MYDAQIANFAKKLAAEGRIHSSAATENVDALAGEAPAEKPKTKSATKPAPKPTTEPAAETPVEQEKPVEEKADEKVQGAGHDEL